MLSILLDSIESARIISPVVDSSCQKSICIKRDSVRIKPSRKVPHKNWLEFVATFYVCILRVVQYCRPDSSPITLPQIGKPEVQMCKGILIKVIHWTQTESDGKVHVLLVRYLKQFHPCWMKGQKVVPMESIGSIGDEQISIWKSPSSICQSPRKNSLYIC